MKYSYSSKSDASSNRSFAAVCIANYQDWLLNQSIAAILAIDEKGKLYSHRIKNIESTESNANKHLFVMELCDDSVDDDKNEAQTAKVTKPNITSNFFSCISIAYTPSPSCTATRPGLVLRATAGTTPQAEVLLAQSRQNWFSPFTGGRDHVH